MASTFDAVHQDYRTEEMLKSWGEWQRKPEGRKISLGYVSMCQVILEGNIGRIIKAVFEPCLPITEDEAKLVEQAVLKLKQRDVVAAQILVKIYVFGHDKTPLAREMRLKRHEMDEKLHKAIGFVDGQLYEKVGVLVA